MFYPGASTSATRRPFHGGKTGIPSVVRPRAGRNRRESAEKRVTPNQGDANVLPRSATSGRSGGGAGGGNGSDPSESERIRAFRASQGPPPGRAWPHECLTPVHIDLA